jgi:hypothetical protein
MLLSEVRTNVTQKKERERERDLVFPDQAMKACKETRGIPPLTSALDASECLTSRPGHFALEEEPQWSLNRRLNWPQDQSARFGEEENFPAVIRTPDCSAPSLLATLITSTRFSSNDHNIVKGAL